MTISSVGTPGTTNPPALYPIAESARWMGAAYTGCTWASALRTPIHNPFCCARPPSSEKLLWHLNPQSIRSGPSISAKFPASGPAVRERLIPIFPVGTPARLCLNFFACSSVIVRGLSLSSCTATWLVAALSLAVNSLKAASASSDSTLEKTIVNNPSEKTPQIMISLAFSRFFSLGSVASFIASTVSPWSNQSCSTPNPVSTSPITNVPLISFFGGESLTCWAPVD